MHSIYQIAWRLSFDPPSDRYYENLHLASLESSCTRQTTQKEDSYGDVWHVAKTSKIQV